MNSKFLWRPFYQFFILQWLTFSALFVGCVFSVYEQNLIENVQVRNIVFSYTALAMILSVILSWLFTIRFSRPMQKALHKAHRIASKKYSQNSEDLEDQDLLEEETEEYSELTMTLEKIDKKLRKRREQLLRERQEAAAFMSSVEESLLSVDSFGHFRYFNSKFASRFIADLKTAGQLSISDVIRAPEIIEAFRAVVQTGQSRNVQVRLSTLHEKMPRDYAVSVAAVKNKQNEKVTGVIFIFHDVSELKLTERIRSDFVTNASHELRTPLTSIKGYVDTLFEDVRKGDYEKAIYFLKIINRNVDRLIDLVNDLLNLSVLENQSEIKLEKLHSLSITENIIRDLSVIAQEKNIQIHVQGQVSEFWGDQRKIEQVLHNLVSNALKYIPDHKIIQVTWLKLENNDIQLCVADNGPGIHLEHQARLFERFYRVDKGRSRDAGGTGLGLAIVKHIMQIHGGRVHVESNAEMGTRFVCTFPNLESRRTIYGSKEI
jgi:two-component system, OmpR family, phosphate regulon sensor histidine kinase PhoR